MVKDTQTDLLSVTEYKKNYVRNPKAKNEKKEEKVQLQVCAYLKRQHPNVIFTCDLASGLFLPPWIGKMHKKMRSSRGMPDLFIAGTNRKVSAADYTTYYGLFIELKKDGLRKLDGSIPPDRRKDKKTGIVTDHHAEQEKILLQLRDQGYKAEFACGFEEAKKLIDNYLG